MSLSSRARNLVPQRFRSSLGSYSLLVLLGSVPVLVLAVVAYVVSARSVERLVHRGNDAAALITAAMVEREFEHWEASLTSHAGFPTLSAAAASGDVEALRERLQIFLSAHERLDRVFVSDTTGLLWVDYPVAPESLGRRFDQRDWFRGVSALDRAYVSEVYRRNAEPRILVVAIAAPIRSPASGERVGFLVAQVRLDGLSGLLGRVEVGDDGFVLLRDHLGAVAAHPALDLRSHRYEGFAALAVPDPASHLPTRSRYTDAFTGEVVMASSFPAGVGDHQWTVVSQQPLATAFAPIRGLALRLGGAGLLTAVLMGILLWGVAREYARRREAEADLLMLNEELERRVNERTDALREKESQLLHAQKMEAVGRLAGGVAHDFNNLLTVILTSSELVLQSLSDQAPERREVEEIRASADRATNLTRQLLAFSRRQVMQPKIIDVNESVDHMRGLLERVIGEDIDLVCRLGSELHPVKFDPGQIEQVVMNLSVNARDAMPGGGKLIIETANVELDDDYVTEHVDAQAGPHVMLAVTDTGCGMDARTRSRIFEPFYTTKRFGQGTGLGLSTVYGIVRQGGGNIWVYSEPGRGTTFKVYLPRTEEVPRPAETPLPVTVSTASGTILVVEDEPGVRNLLVRLLTDAGYDVLAAEDGHTAVETLREAGGVVDLLLMDVVLPDTNGAELAARLAHEQRNVPTLYMSGYTDDAVVHHGVLEEGTAFIQKPFRAQDLLRRIGEQLSDHAELTNVR